MARRRPDRRRAPRRRREDRDRVRSIAIPSLLAEELWQQRRRSAYSREDELVFCHPERGTIYRYERFRDDLEVAFARAGLDWPEGFRPCHDLRVTSITNDALAGANPVALMAKAGHANIATTRRYLKLAGSSSVTRPRAPAAAARAEP